VFITAVKEPILIVIGKKDIQVDWQADGKALEAAAKDRAVSFFYPENADHVLKFEEKPRDKLSAESCFDIIHLLVSLTKKRQMQSLIGLVSKAKTS